MTEIIKCEVMTSREIAEVTGKRHADVLRDIRILVEQIDNEDKRNFALVEYTDIKGEKRPMYELTKKGCLCLASGYDAGLRMRIINRWEELETKERQNVPTLPQTYLEALEALVQSEKAKQKAVLENEKLQLENTELKPKAEFFDAVTDSKDTFDMAAVAKVLNMGIGRTKLFQLLRDKKVLRHNNEPYQKYVDDGWFRQIETTFCLPDGSQKMYRKTVVFQKGLEGIRKLVKQRKEMQK